MLIWTGRGLATGAGSAVVFAILAVGTQRVLPREFVIGAMVLALFGLLAGAILGYFWVVPPDKAARFYDRQFLLKERLSTAVENDLPSESVPTVERKPSEPTLIQLQLEDTIRAAHNIDQKKGYPLKVPIREIILALILSALVLLIWQRGEPYFKAAQQFRRTQEAIAAEAEKIEALITQIDQNPELTEAEKQALIEPLQDTLNQLSETKSLEEAVSALDEAEKTLREIAEGPGSNEQLQALEEAGEALAEAGEGPLQSVAEALADGNLAEAAENLSEIDLEALSEEERAELAEQLSSAAETLEETNPELAGQLQEASEAIQQDDLATAQEALQTAAESLENAAQQAAQSQAASEAADALSDGQEQLADAGQDAAQTADGTEISSGENTTGDPVAGNGEQGNPGTDPVENDSSNQGDGPGNGEQGENGTGAGQGESDGSGTDGQQAGETIISQGNDPGDGGERGYVPITPEGLERQDGDTITLPPSGLEGENTVGQGDSGTGEEGASSVPYEDIFSIYQDAAYEAIEAGDIPLELRVLIREYFSSLEP